MFPHVYVEIIFIILVRDNFVIGIVVLKLFSPLGLIDLKLSVTEAAPLLIIQVCK